MYLPRLAPEGPTIVVLVVDGIGSEFQLVPPPQMTRHTSIHYHTINTEMHDHG